MTKPDPQWLCIRAGTLRRYRALSLARSGRLLEAEQDLAVARQLHPTDGSIAADHARILIRLGHVDACMTALDDAARLGHEPAQVSRMKQSLVESLERKEARQRTCNLFAQSVRACGRGSVALCTGRDGNPDHSAAWKLRRARVIQVLVICTAITVARIVLGA